MTKLLADIFDEGYTNTAGKLDQSSQDSFNDLDLPQTSQNSTSSKSLSPNPTSPNPTSPNPTSPNPMSSTSTSSNSKSINNLFLINFYLVVKNKICRGFMLQWFQFSKAPLSGWTQTHPMLNIIIILVDCDHNILRLNRWLSTETGFSVNRTYFPVAV